jgi:4-carboxymuconolactone decarboxylase
MTEPVMAEEGAADADGDGAARIRAIYAARGAQVPASVEARIELAESVDRMDALEAVENLKRALIAQSALDAKTEQLIQFAQLLVLGHAATAAAHVRGARRAGASMAELTAVVEHAAITAGLPAYTRGMDILVELAKESS